MFGLINTNVPIAVTPSRNGKSLIIPSAKHRLPIRCTYVSVMNAHILLGAGTPRLYEEIW
jgi:hypothetical protein